MPPKGEGADGGRLEPVAGGVPPHGRGEGADAAAARGLPGRLRGQDGPGEGGDAAEDGQLQRGP